MVKNIRKRMGDPLELIIPPQMMDRSRSLKTSNAGDVSRSYNITLKSPRNENLFIDNEEDLRDLLQEYLNYRRRQKEAEENIRKQNAENSNDTDQSESANRNRKKKVAKRTTKITRVEYYRTPDDSVDNTNIPDQTSTVINEEPCCSHDCKGVSGKKKGSCCVIL